MNDCYEILGVTRDASQSKIKKAYRKKTRRLYPDYVGPESEETFEGLSITYGALSDPEKRRLCDAGGADAPRGGTSPFQGAGGFSDFFDAMFSGFSGASSGPTPHGRRGAGQFIGVDITLKGTVFSTQETVSFITCIKCGICYGLMCAEGTQPVTCSNCSGSSTVTWISNTMFGQMQSRAAYGACRDYGTIVSSPCQRCTGQGRVRSCRSYPIDTPTGVTEGTWIRIPDEAEVDPDDGPQRDLYLEIRELTDEVFMCRGDNLRIWTAIPMTTTASGTDFVLLTFGGERTVTIPAGTQPGEGIILRELGVGHLQRPGRGNLHVHIEVEIPKKLNARSHELLEELAALHKEGRVGPQRRDHLTFEKLKEEFAGQ